MTPEQWRQRKRNQAARDGYLKTCRKPDGAILRTRIFGIWNSIKRRSKEESVHVGWQSFGEFRSWCLQAGVGKDLRFSRRVCDAGFTPENCEFVTKVEQGNRNVRRRKKCGSRDRVVDERGRTISKACSSCGEMLDAHEFHISMDRFDGLHSACRLCMSEYRRQRREVDEDWRRQDMEASKEYKKNNRDRFRRSQRSATLKAKYGISIEDYERMFDEQGGRCAICGRDDNAVSWGDNLHVDHCHKTGKVRGLLCQPCNTGIGFLQDDVSRLEAAIEYIKEAA